MRVPTPLADDMAAELTADLEEAASEDRTVEDVLGHAAVDPRSFAEAWAAERGLGRRRSARRKRAVLLAALAAFIALGLVGASLALFDSESHPVRTAGPKPATFVLPPRPPQAQAARVTLISAWAGPTDRSSDDESNLGVVLLLAGLGGTATLTFYSLWRRSTAL
jgi:hypothetical protein